MKRLLHLCFTVLLVTEALSAVARESISWEAVRKQQADGLDLKFTLPKDRFFQGEVISATLTFSNIKKNGYRVWTGTIDTYGRLGDIAFFADNSKGERLPDPLAWYPRLQHFTSKDPGPLGWNDRVTDWQWIEFETWTMTLSANQWLRFDQPGTYDIFAFASRVQDLNATDSYKHLPLVSNKITITISPRTPVEEAAVLNSSKGPLLEENEENREKLNRLRFLDTPASRLALMPVLDNQNFLAFEAEAGLAATAFPKGEAPRILQVIREGKLRFSSNLLIYYMSLKGYPHFNFWNFSSSDPKNEPAKEKVAALKAAEGELVTAAREGAKGDPKALAAIANGLWYLKRTDPEARRAAVIYQLDFTPEQKQLLFGLWEQYGGPEFMPVLRDSCAKFDQRAFETLCDYFPEEARPLLVADMQRKRSAYLPSNYDTTSGSKSLWFHFSRQPLPELTEFFRKKLDEKGCDYDLWIPMVERFGTPDLAPQVIALYPKKDGYYITTPWLMIWMRHDPQGALKALSQAIHPKRGKIAYAEFDKVLIQEWHPDAEPLLLRFLQESDEDVVMASIRALMEKGSPSAASAAVVALKRIDAFYIEDENNSRASRRWQHAELAKSLLASKRWSYSPEQTQTLKQFVSSSH